MLSALGRVPAFLLKPSLTRAACFTSTRTLLQAGKGFGEAPKPPQEPPKDKAPRKAKSLMPLADEAASKLLVKEGPDGAVKFDNPAVGDFQVLDALVEVSRFSCISMQCAPGRPWTADDAAFAPRFDFVDKYMRSSLSLPSLKPPSLCTLVRCLDQQLVLQVML